MPPKGPPAAGRRKTAGKRWAGPHGCADTQARDWARRTQDAAAGNEKGTRGRGLGHPPRLRLPPEDFRTLGNPALFPVRGARSRWAILAIPAFFQDRVSARQCKPAGTTRSWRSGRRIAWVRSSPREKTLRLAVSQVAPRRAGSDLRRGGSLTRAARKPTGAPCNRLAVGACPERAVRTRCA